MTELIEILKYVGPQAAFFIVVLFLVFRFLSKILQPMFEQTNKTFQEYNQNFEKLVSHVESIDRSLMEIDRNTRSKEAT